MTLLGFHGDAAAALAAVQEAAINVALEPHRIGLAAPFHRLLHAVERCLGDERLMLAFVHFSFVDEIAVVKGISEKILESEGSQTAAVGAPEPPFIHHLAKLDQRIFAGGVEFKSRLDEWRPLGIGNNRPQLRLVEIADGGLAWIDAVGDFLFLAAADIYGETVGVILGLAEGEIEHELALGGRLKPERAELKVAEFLFVDEVDDSAAVEGVAGESVGMPGDDAVSFTLLDAVEHFVELRPALGHGALAFLEAADDVEMLPGYQFADFSQLVADAPNLPVFGASRFTNVDKEFSC